MTAQLFLSRHGLQWQALKRDPMFRDLIEYLREQDPSRVMDMVTAGDTTNHSAALLGRIAGFNLALKAITSLEMEEPTTPPEEKYQDEETTDA